MSYTVTEHGVRNNASGKFIGQIERVQLLDSKNETFSACHHKHEK